MVSEKRTKEQTIELILDRVGGFGPDLPCSKIARLCGMSKSPQLWRYLFELVDQKRLTMEISVSSNHRETFVFSIPNSKKRLM